MFSSAGTDCECHFGVIDGADGDGNLYSQRNIDSFVGDVLKLHSGGVTWAFADGGFVAARDRHDQEAVMFRLIVCEVQTALRVLSVGGSLVLKAFDCNSQPMQCESGVELCC